jgi:hypothetical protein
MGCIHGLLENAEHFLEVLAEKPRIASLLELHLIALIAQLLARHSICENLVPQVVLWLHLEQASKDGITLQNVLELRYVALAIDEIHQVLTTRVTKLLRL